MEHEASELGHTRSGHIGKAIIINDTDPARALRYKARFALGLDPEASTEVSFSNLMTARHYARAGIDEDFLGTPRVYVEELTHYPEDRGHFANPAWETVGLYGHDDDSWSWVELD